MKTRRRFTLAFAILLCLSAAGHQGQARQQSKNKDQAVPPAAASSPVTGSGTPGRVSKWTGVDGTSTFTLGDSNIFEDKFGRVGIGRPAGSSLLTVAGVIEATGGVFGSLSIGTAPPGSGLSVVVSSSTPAIFANNTGAGGGILGQCGGVNNVLAGKRGVLGVCDVGPGVRGQSLSNTGVLGGSQNGWGVNGESDTNAGVRGLGATGVLGESQSGIGVKGESASGSGVTGTSAGSGSNLAGVKGTCGSCVGVLGESTSNYGVYGRSTSNFGVFGLSNDIGVYGSSLNGAGVYGVSTNSVGMTAVTFSPDPTVQGLLVFSSGTPNGAISARLKGTVRIENDTFSGATQPGDLIVAGKLQVTSGMKMFHIDHPLDPENKYLNHAAIESSEVLNLYSGNIATDQNGDAEVQLPDWFEALNQDFRYQLTVVGTFAQAIVASKIKGNRFAIRTNAPNVEVSWQVTSVRSDPTAKKFKFEIEEEKTGRERGTYLNPDAFGQPEERSVNWARNPESMQQRKQRRLEGVPSRQRQPDQR